MANTSHTYNWALITGATSGIGKTFAEQLPASTNLLLTGRNEKVLAELKEKLATDNRAVETFVADLAKEADMKKLADWAAEYGIDLFINNAGFGFYGNVLENSPENEAGMGQVNVVASTYLARRLLPGMVERADAKNPTGMIVLASVGGFMPLPGFTTYAATKAYNLHYAEGLAEELKNTHCNVMALCPGPTSTGFGNVAGLGKSFRHKSVSPEVVVAKAIKALNKGRRICVPTCGNKLGTILPRFLPRRVVAFMGGEIMKRSNH